MKNPLDTKLYYSISEVAEIAALQPYTLRAWEKDFSCLKPRRMGGKNRAYRERDIGIVLLIKYLLYEARYTTQGVKQRLKNEPELIQAIAKNSTAVQHVIRRMDGGIEAIATAVRQAEKSGGAREDKKKSNVELRVDPNGEEASKRACKKLLHDTREELKELIGLLS